MLRPYDLLTLLLQPVLVLVVSTAVAGELFAQEIAQQAVSPESQPAATDVSSSAQAAPADVPTSSANEASATSSQSGDTEGATEGQPVAAKQAEFKLPPPPPQTGPKVPFEMQRYQVELPIVFQPHAKLGSQARKSILSDLQSLIDRSVGPMWDLQISEPDWITPRSKAGLERITVENLKQRAVEFRFATAIREQLSVYSKGAFPVKSDEPLSDEMRIEIREILGSTDNDSRQPLITSLVQKIASGHAAAETQIDTVSEVVHLYLTPAPLNVDKIFPVSIEMQGGSYVICAREWDRESELLSSVRTRTTIDRRTIATQILRLLGEVFRPVVQIDEATPTSARIRFKAGEYPPADPAFAQVTKGSMYVPFFRYLDRNKVTQKLQFLPWSYITATEPERIRANCVLDTGVKTPLGSFKRRRMELRALALKPYLQYTSLTLVPKRNRTRPLVGYLVAVYDEIPPPPPKSDEEPAEDAADRPKPEIFRSNRYGNVTIPVDPNKPLRWVYVRSGSALLAKFPLVAGAEPQMMVECPDDTIRLDVEGQIVLLQSRLIDTIAKQAMVKAMLTNRTKKGEWDKVDESLDEFDALPTIKSFEKMVFDIQYPALKKAEARHDRSSESRIKKLGQAVLKVARLHLDQEKIDEFREEIIEQRRLENPNASDSRSAPGQR
ncbi:MAG: hypothetical protein O3B13_02270 [Planctomycetota bacterium]|nr:hypothetical protein [Planctomycetota bacterium]MDA1161905.1 hypothetical protein [Planctomycetota bacterium]